MPCERYWARPAIIAPCSQNSPSGSAKAVDSLRGRGRLTEDNIADSLREVRMALLEADVALPVVKRFIDAVKAKALGTEVAGQPHARPGADRRDPR